MTAAEEKDLLAMTKAIYYHLGLDGYWKDSLRESREKVENDVLKWNEKRRMKEHERVAN